MLVKNIRQRTQDLQNSRLGTRIRSHDSYIAIVLMLGSGLFMSSVAATVKLLSDDISVFEIVFEPQYVTARCLFHPEPRILCLQHGRPLRSAPRGAIGGENRYLRRPNPARLIGYPT